MQGQLRFERLISNLSARFVNVSRERVDDEIENTREAVCDFFDVDCCAELTQPGGPA